MSDKAYVLGVNRKRLEFAEKDADAIERILSSYGYDPVRLKADKLAVLTELDNMVDNSGPNDRVIFYYSGHGLLESGTLHLLLTEDSERESSKLSITTIYEKLEKCRAAWKLLILDCCHAKAESLDWAARRSERFLVLTASKRLEQAKELKTLQAGFLTHHLCQALGATNSGDAGQRRHAAHQCGM